ncbi:helix-turn-helix transcriptional regulator [Tsukamurella tyrosinosolvens]|uniref:helix-turn-helix transcriptional regulator n=1 Tax=Tsukamurella tyrosinosolvens TaxID=57704 RepID=UPI002DD430E1|nr:helix-turn-helix domain-containing protein [Tsukamurella tyrosinosolvens]MEC4612905.1 helix-turn-helix domain-containing protein [Tsukamurella tyrosinosolvens]
MTPNKYTVPDAAAMIGVSPTTLYRWISLERVPAQYAVSGRLYLTAEQVHHLARERTDFHGGRQ